MRKIILLLLALNLFSSALQAQQKTFLRIFDLSGKKIGKGFLQSTTDSSIRLTKDSGMQEFSVANIGFIKTKHSGGHTILISSLAGGVAIALLSRPVPAVMMIAGSRFLPVKH